MLSLCWQAAGACAHCPLTAALPLRAGSGLQQQHASWLACNRLLAGSKRQARIIAASQAHGARADEGQTRQRQLGRADVHTSTGHDDRPFEATSTMPKSSGKKRRRSDAPNVDLLCNVTGIEGPGSQADDSMEACLAEMEGAQVAPSENKGATAESSAARPIARNNVWKSALSEWVTTGKYTAGLPNPQAEVSRHFHTQQLSSFLLKQCPTLRMPSFERWLLDSKWEEYGSKNVDDDPIMPCQSSLESEASQRLIEEIEYADDKMTKEQAEEIVRELCLKTKHAVQEVAAMSSRRLAPLSKGSHIELEKGSSQHTLRYKRKSWKKSFSIQVNVSHYDKLWDTFLKAQPSLKRQKRILPSFQVLVFCLLLRYSSLSGGQLINDLRGGGMQGAVMPEAFDVLQHFFPSQEIVECFASPWNAHLPLYASAFADLDTHFNSIGDFRRLNLQEGTYEANPPFSPGLMMDMVERMNDQLTEATQVSKRLTFFVIVPTAEDDSSGPPAKRHAAKSFSELINSPYWRLHIMLPSREHGYVEGAQHLRPTQYKQSQYDTSLILLQSDAAHAEFSSCHKSFEKKMRKAFESRHEEEIQERQQKKHRS